MRRIRDGGFEERAVLSFSRKIAVALFRGLTGHDGLQYHIYTIGVLDSTDCVLCDSSPPMTFEHLNNHVFYFLFYFIIFFCSFAKQKLQNKKGNLAE